MAAAQDYWETDDNGFDPDIDMEIRGHKIGKDGNTRDQYDRPNNRPEDNAAMNLFQIE
jgi:hypothetical protein